MGRDDLPVVSGATIKYSYGYQFIGDTNYARPCSSDCLPRVGVQRNQEILLGKRRGSVTTPISVIRRTW